MFSIYPCPFSFKIEVLKLPLQSLDGGTRYICPVCARMEVIWMDNLESLASPIVDIVASQLAPMRWLSGSTGRRSIPACMYHNDLAQIGTGAILGQRCIAYKLIGVEVAQHTELPLARTRSVSFECGIAQPQERRPISAAGLLRHARHALKELVGFRVTVLGQVIERVGSGLITEVLIGVFAFSSITRPLQNIQAILRHASCVITNVKQTIAGPSG